MGRMEEGQLSHAVHRWSVGRPGTLYSVQRRVGGWSC